MSGSRAVQRSIVDFFFKKNNVFPLARKKISRALPTLDRSERVEKQSSTRVEHGANLGGVKSVTQTADPGIIPGYQSFVIIWKIATS
jgi:hypothetical protein